MRVAITHPHVFQVAGTINRAHSLSRRYLRHRGNMPPIQANVSPEGIAEFSSAISAYFRQNEGRGHRYTADAYLRVNRYHSFFAYPDNYADMDMGHEEQGRVIVDRFDHYETLDAEFAQICRRLHIPVRLVHTNASLHPPYRDCYGHLTRDRIADLYRTDIALFGYEP